MGQAPHLYSSRTPADQNSLFFFFFFCLPLTPPPPQLFVLLFFLSFFTFIFIVILYFTVWDVEPLVTHRHLGLESQVYPCHALRKHSVSTRSALTWHLVGTHGWHHALNSCYTVCCSTATEERHNDIFSQPSRLYTCARAVVHLINSISSERLSVLFIISSVYQRPCALGSRWYMVGCECCFWKADAAHLWWQNACWLLKPAFHSDN